jgi:hypothetical protein
MAIRQVNFRFLKVKIQTRGSLAKTSILYIEKPKKQTGLLQFIINCIYTLYSWLIQLPLSWFIRFYKVFETTIGVLFVDPIYVASHMLLKTWKSEVYRYVGLVGLLGFAYIGYHDTLTTAINQNYEMQDQIASINARIEKQDAMMIQFFSMHKDNQIELVMRSFIHEQDIKNLERVLNELKYTREQWGEEKSNMAHYLNTELPGKLRSKLFEKTQSLFSWSSESNKEVVDYAFNAVLFELESGKRNVTTICQLGIHGAV